jgi:hypothetical protein
VTDTERSHELEEIQNLLGLTKLAKENNQCIDKNGSTEHSKRIIKQYQKKWLQHVQRTDTDYQNKHYNINQKDEVT